ncbi:L,D-transpeptidase family protein [Geoalkalibacter sp.]|uniref:L,D-transpeptidase family protein n=1 Tax=Geoalkalibacter sp. TaxID=3041440 RepID=UPI00272E46DF|nr:L,D-transpeptidase family protein [Geoalkalibacter sp.]
MIGAPKVGLVVGEERILPHDEVPTFYAQRDHAPAWFDAGALSPQAEPLLSELRAADQHGLNTQDYHLAAIAVLLAKVQGAAPQDLLADSLSAAQLDVLLTHAFLLHAARLTSGQVDPNRLFPGEWQVQLRKADGVAVLGAALASGQVGEALRGLSPPQSGYAKLREVLGDYRRIAEQGGWPEVPDGPTLRRGESDPRVPLLRERLWISGDLKALPEEQGDLYDAETAAAVWRFQRRHGLSADRVVGPKTLAELNRPVEERIRQIELNLERYRWLPKDLGRRHIRVNIADFTLQVIEAEQVVMRMPVVVGTHVRKTPVFSGRMTYLEFAPYWGVPPTILAKDKLPRLRKDPGYFDANHYEILPWQGPPGARIHPDDIDWRRVTARSFPGLLRQRPGPWNPLGQVKFMFPNEFDIYLHDTPDRHLFRQAQRTFSSGCIRIQRPADLAQYLLEDDPQWDCERLHLALNASEPQRVMLRRPMPVHLLYFTAWVDAEGIVQFRRDLYERDAVLDLALRKHQDASRLARLSPEGPTLGN